MSNTGVPLNLPKPTSASNTGQDMIQMASSLQAINDKIKEIETNIGLFKVVTGGAGAYPLAPNTTYLLVVTRVGVSGGFSSMYTIRTDGSTAIAVPIYTSGHVTVTPVDLAVRVEAGVSVRVALITLS